MSGRAAELTIITPAQLFYSGQVELVRVTTMDGEEGFKAGHAWCVKLLAENGHVRLQEAAAVRTAALKGGHIDIKDKFVIYAEDAAWAEQ